MTKEMTVAELNLSTRINNALNIFFSQHNKNIDSVLAKELALWHPHSFFRIRALGRKSVREIIAALDAAGFPQTMRYELTDLKGNLDGLLFSVEQDRKRLKKMIAHLDRVIGDL